MQSMNKELLCVCFSLFLNIQTLTLLKQAKLNINLLKVNLVIECELISLFTI